MYNVLFSEGHRYLDLELVLQFKGGELERVKLTAECYESFGAPIRLDVWRT